MNLGKILGILSPGLGLATGQFGGGKGGFNPLNLLFGAAGMGLQPFGGGGGGGGSQGTPSGEQQAPAGPAMGGGQAEGGGQDPMDLLRMFMARGQGGNFLGQLGGGGY